MAKLEQPTKAQARDAADVAPQAPLPLRDQVVAAVERRAKAIAAVAKATPPAKVAERDKHLAEAAKLRKEIDAATAGAVKERKAAKVDVEKLRKTDNVLVDEVEQAVKAAKA